MAWGKAENWLCKQQNNHWCRRNLKDIFDEDYIHPIRTGRNTAKWLYW